MKKLFEPFRIDERPDSASSAGMKRLRHEQAMVRWHTLAALRIAEERSWRRAMFSVLLLHAALLLQEEPHERGRRGGAEKE